MSHWLLYSLIYFIGAWIVAFAFKLITKKDAGFSEAALAALWFGWIWAVPFAFTGWLIYKAYTHNKL